MTPVGAHEAVGETGVMNAAPTTPRSALAAYFGNWHYRARVPVEVRHYAVCQLDWNMWVVGAAFMTPVGAHEAVGETGVMNAAPTTPRSALAAYFGNRHYRPRSRPHLLWFMGEGKTTYQEVL